MVRLFDPDAFDAALEDGRPSLPLFRDTIVQARRQLAERFHAGDEITCLVRGYAHFIDEMLGRLWRLHGCDRHPQLALVAVGGYGRGELHPHSDIDLLFLGDERSLASAGEQLQALITSLWDLKLDIGHSVRTLEDCVEQGRADITVATNLMESRLLAGDDALYQAMRETTDRDHIWPGREFFEAKWAEQIARHKKYNDTAYNLEPNVKEGPGGLRDIQMVGWVAKRHFGVETLQALVDKGFLTSGEYQALVDGQAFLWKVRFGLHVITDRSEDRLLFDHQRTLARLFGYPEGGPRLPVEQFMKDYYRTVMELERLNEMLLQLFQEQILYADDSSTPVPINERFQARKGFIEAVDDQIFEQYPPALLEVFLLLAKHADTSLWYGGETSPADEQLRLRGIRAETIRLIRNQRHLIDDSFRADSRCRELFIEILRQPEGITHELRRMNRYGILAAYLPEFGHIVGQMQHDLFHVYTVDEHTLTVVRNLRRFTVAVFHHEFPLCSSLIQQLEKPELLYIVGLYHDIAKGRGGDHSQLGATDAEAFCRHHFLSESETRLVTWLVRNHLLMSTTAQRQDISDPAVINRFAQQVGNKQYLDHLYLLTVADVRATSPNVWNSWKDALLVELYQAARNALRRGLGNPLHEQDLVEQSRNEARKKLHNYGFSDRNIERIWQRLGNEYFLRYSADEICWHTQAIAKSKDGNKPLVLIRQQTRRGGTEIFIYTPIRGAQFTTTTGTLEQLGLNVLDARIIPSRDGYTLDSYIVLEEDGEPIHSSYRIREIEQALAERLEHPSSSPMLIKRRVARQLKHFPIPTRVRFEMDSRNSRTIMEVVASDRPGLLSRIARAMADCNVLMQNAKIATLGERAEDIFFITDRENRPLQDEEQLACLKQRIIESLENEG